MKLKIGNTTGGGETSFRLLRDYGYQCADFQMAHVDKFLYTCTHDEFEKALYREKAIADANGIEIHQMHGPWGQPDNDLEFELSPETLKARLEERKKSISACPYLGCKNWVIHPIFPYGRNDEERGKGEEAYKINFEFYSELVETAREYDVTICFENMPFRNCCLNDVVKIKKFVDAIDDDHFKACLDTGHVIALDTMSLGDAVRVLGKDLKTLHVHDSRPGYDYHAMPYFGSGDWKGFYEGLCDVGYDGVFNLECSPPGKISPVIKEELNHMLVRLAKQILNEPV